MNLRKALVAALAYSVAVFAIGFIVGTSRTLLVVPRVGETAAVALETPVMLAISWLVSRKTMHRFDVPRDIVTRVVMALVALFILLALEAAVSVGLFHRTLAQHFATYGTLSGLIGLGAQFVFASFPVLQIRTVPRGLGARIA